MKGKAGNLSEHDGNFQNPTTGNLLNRQQMLEDAKKHPIIKMDFKVLNLLKEYRYLGEQKLESGTLLIGKAPHIAPQAWLHRIYFPLKIEEINELEVSCGHTIPADYKKFLSVSNGLSVFNLFSLYGKRHNYIRNIENVWQPFDIITPNTMERPINAGDHLLIIGSYSYDGSKLYMDNVTNAVHLCGRYDTKSLFKWNSFEKMLYTEVARLITLFDEKGKQIVKNKSTLPI